MFSTLVAVDPAGSNVVYVAARTDTTSASVATTAPGTSAALQDTNLYSCIAAIRKNAIDVAHTRFIFLSGNAPNPGAQEFPGAFSSVQFMECMSPDPYACKPLKPFP